MDIQSLPLLSLLIWLPIASGLLVLYIGDQRQQMAKGLSLIVSVLVFLLSVLLYLQFDNSTHLMQFVEFGSWIEPFNINYHLGVDGIAIPLILLTTFTNILVIPASCESINTRLSQYLAAFLILEGVMIGVFSSLDAILFYFFWEAMLIPMFLIIGIWGGPRRVYATVKFFLYTFLGSVFM
ncbi:MAG: proton-conducting transporter membrane subunit, partial [Gammaproteobacteria bacterium]